MFKLPGGFNTVMGNAKEEKSQEVTQHCQMDASVRALHFHVQDTATELTGCLAAAAAAAAAAFIPAVGYILCQQRILLLPAPRPPDAAAAAAAAAGAALPPGVLLRLLWLLLLLVCRVLRGPADVLALA